MSTRAKKAKASAASGVGGRTRSAWVSALAALALVICAGEARAQLTDTPPPDFGSYAPGGGGGSGGAGGGTVDLARGTYNHAMTDVSIGRPGAGGLSFTRYFRSGAQWRHNFDGSVNPGATTTVSIGGASETFTESSGVYTSSQRMGATLTYDATPKEYTYISRLGVIAIFDEDVPNCSHRLDVVACITSITNPDGERTDFHYNSVTVGAETWFRLQSVTNNLGYQIHLEYANNSPSVVGDKPEWYRLVKVTAINNAVDYCAPTANTCGGFTVTWPTATYAVSGGSSQYETVTNAEGEATRITYNGAANTTGTIVGIRRPTSTTDDHITVVYSNGRVSAVRHWTSGSTYDQWTYAYGSGTTTVTDPLSHGRTITYNSDGLITGETDPLSRSTSYTYDAYNRRTRATQHEGNYIEYTYSGDDRGNIIQTDVVPKSGSGLATLTSTASFPANCTATPRVICNQPNSTTDARGYTTDYTYDTTHGGVLTITAPDPDGGGALVRPQTRITYDDFTAYYKQPSSPSTPAAAASVVYRPIQMSACATSSWSGSACSAGAGDETRTTIAYETSTGGNNVLPISVTAASGSGSISSASAMTYDAISNQLTVDGPLTNDTVRTRYDAMRRVIGVVGPDPDDGGALKHRATRITYNDDGNPTSIEQGHVNSQSDGDWSGFTTLETQTTTYNFRGQAIQGALVVSSTTQAVVQASYDAAGRSTCMALRMNPAVFGSLPSSACTLGTQGSNGPDRITYTQYNNADQPISVTRAYGTSLATVEQAVTYTNNRLVATIADANGSLTTNEYDGHDRLVKVRYPNPSSAGSSATDYEQYTYGTSGASTGLLTQLRRRDGNSITYTHDNLGRVTFADAPSTAQDITTTYDSFSRVITVAANSQTLTYTYDQLSRLLSEAQPQGSVSYQYNAAGQRTRMDWPSSALYVTYDYDRTGAVTAIRENGAGSGIGVLATYAYDNLGRRTSLTRGNGTVESYSYDAESRLSALANDLASTGYDNTVSFSYSEASEILTRNNSNASYNWSPASPVTIAYADNNLNQYTSVGGTSYSYDARGNLTNDGTNAYTYDIYNRLITGPSSATLAYDPAGRLYQTAGGVTTRFLYDGVALIAELNTSGTVLRRYVHGPGVDEPIVWYERNGGGTYDRNWLVADERGSITAIANDSGVGTSINTYDEYGAPASGNTGRFQYTGQTWIPEIGLYYYKARFYSPRLGRFMQTDPIGFVGGMNIYAYVGNSPLNGRDPSGLKSLLSWLIDHDGYDAHGGSGGGWFGYPGGCFGNCGGRGGGGDGGGGGELTGGAGGGGNCECGEPAPGIGHNNPPSDPSESKPNWFFRILGRLAPALAFFFEGSTVGPEYDALPPSGPGVGDWSRVGRWMSQEELTTMQETGRWWRVEAHARAMWRIRRIRLPSGAILRTPHMSNMTFQPRLCVPQEKGGD